MTFKEDLVEGLTAQPKYLYSKYFYDAEGDRLFQEIMKMPEYYLTDSEYEVFSTRAEDILRALSEDSEDFELVEFGAGDGYKTKVLIQRLREAGAHFRYLPIDISNDVLGTLTNNMAVDFPDLEVLPLHTDYFSALAQVNKVSEKPKLVLFIGSSIGNFRPGQTEKFLTALQNALRPGDQVLIGFDLQKNPKTILDAYNDPTGITKAFNLNVLRRANRELGANFSIESFDHYPTYDPSSGMALSYLVSLKSQVVYVEAADLTVEFKTGETIHTEISRKFSIEQIDKFLADAGFRRVEHFFDCKHYFVDTLAIKPKS